MRVDYERLETGYKLLLTFCPYSKRHKKVASIDCAKCQYFESVNRPEKYVICKYKG